MRVFIIFLLLLMAGAGAAMNWQHNRYLDLRRGPVQDRQEIFHEADVFHVATWLQTAPGTDVIDALRDLKQSTEGGPDWIYAGKAVLNGVVSEQLGPAEWSAVILLQYPTRQAYDTHVLSEAYQEALAKFERTYSHGMQRSAAQNMLLPQAFLARRVMRLLTFQPNIYPLKQLDSDAMTENAALFVPRLRAERELGRDAVVIANLIKPGTVEQQAADAEYVGAMFDLMAERGYGPMHLGSAVALPGGHDFDQVAFVYYPGVDYFASMLQSEYFQGIIGGKQLGDTQATVTVPILDLL